MTQELLKSKLDNLARFIQRIESKQPFSVEELKSNFDLQDIIVLNLERAVQICVDLAAIMLSMSSFPAPPTMSASFQALQQLGLIDSDLCVRLQKSVGFRNIAVHEYEKINWEVVYQIIHRHLSDLRKFGAILAQKV